MEQGINFIKSNCSSYTNALHGDFMDVMFTNVNDGTVSLATINVSTELMSEWRGYIDLEIRHNRVVTATADTGRMDAFEKERDEFVTYLLQFIRTAAASPIAATKEAGMVLLPIADKYTGIQRAASKEETNLIKGMLVDFRKEKYAAAVATLRLEEVLDALEVSNNNYQALQIERATTRADEKLPPAKEIRPLSEACLERVCLLIMASYLLSTSAEDKAAMAKLAEKMNQQIAEFKAAYNQSQAQKGGTTGGSGSNPGTLPEDGTTPAPDEGTDTTPDEGGTTPDEGGTTPDEGGETPEGGGSDSGTEGGETGGGTSGGGDDYDDGGSLVG